MTRQRALTAAAVLACLLAVASADLFPPKCKCDRNLLHSAYRMRLTSSKSTASMTEVCFTAYTVSCDTTKYCCKDQPMYKVEYAVGESTY